MTNNTKLTNELIGCTLIRITRNSDSSSVEILFEKNKIRYNLSFDGYLMETKISPLNDKVSYINLGSTLGFRSIGEVRSRGHNIDDYQQLFIQMEGSKEDAKIELIAAVKNYKIVKSLRDSGTLEVPSSSNERVITFSILAAVVGIICICVYKLFIL